MLNRIALVACLFASGVALAQSLALENTCQTVAKNFLLSDRLAVGIIQSFPELKPAGVRMTYSTREGATRGDMADTFECEFDAAEPPYHLTRFCVSNTCYSPKEQDGERKRRFEEVRILLERSGKQK